MPVLSISTVCEFHDYLQGKVRGHFPDWKTYQGNDRYSTTTPFCRIKSIREPLTPGCRISAISRRVSTLLEIISLNDIPVNIKVTGEVKCLSDQGVFADISEKTSDKARKSSPVVLSKLTEHKFDEIIKLLCGGGNQENIENKIGVLAYMLTFSSLFRTEGGIMFPRTKGQ